MKTLTGIVMGLVMLAGCGDDDSAKPKCERLVHAYCERVVSCARGDDLVDAAEAAQLRSDCIDEITSTALDCSEADDVSSDYGACLRQTEQLDCGASNASLLVDELVAPPDICEGSILFAE